MKIKRIVFTESGKAELLDFDIPFNVKEDEVAGKTLCTLISPGTELIQYKGHPRFKFPHEPGYASIFIIDKVGKAVKDFKKGHIVFCMGKHQSHHIKHFREVYHVFSNVKLADSLFARIIKVFESLRKDLSLNREDRVLVYGMGLIGHFFYKMLDYGNYKVDGYNKGNLRYNIALMNNFKIDMEFEEDKYDMVVECTGTQEGILDACKACKKGGRILMVGVPWKNFRNSEILRLVFYKSLRIDGGWEWKYELGNEFEMSLRLLANGSISVGDIYDIAKPEEAQEVYQKYLNGKNSKLTTVFDWNKEK